MTKKLGVFCLVLLCCLTVSSTFMNLRYEKTNFRYGPEMTFPLKFTWNGLGLPVEVLKEQGGWVYVQDSEGDYGWIQRRMLTKRGMVLVKKDTEIRDKKTCDSKIVAFIKNGALLHLKECDGDACRVQVAYQDKKIGGWVFRQFLWGIA